MWVSQLKELEEEWGKVAPGAPRQSRYIRSQQQHQQQQRQADSPADEADHDQSNGTLFNMENYRFNGMKMSYHDYIIITVLTWYC